MHLKPREYLGVSAASQAWIPVDHHTPQPYISFRVTQGGTPNDAAATFQLQYTLDDVQNASTKPAVSALAITAIDSFVNPTAIPAWEHAVAAFRLRVLAVSGTGTNVTFRILQQGN